MATETYDYGVCQSALTECATYTYEFSLCLSTQSIATSCRCAISLVTQETLCLSLGDTCQHKTINISALDVFSACPEASRQLLVRLLCGCARVRIRSDPGSALDYTCVFHGYPQLHHLVPCHRANINNPSAIHNDDRHEWW